MLQKKKRLVWPDVFKTFGIIMVILQHSWEEVINYPVYSDKQRILFGILSTFSRSGVPLFIFITGYFSLKKYYENEGDLIKYWKRKISKFIITASIWFMIIWIIQGNYSQHFAELTGLFLIGPYQTPFIQFWYVPVAVILWITLPLISIAKNQIKRVGKLILGLILVIPFIYDTIITLVNQFHYFHLETISSSFPTTFVGYIFLACIGYLLSNTVQSHQYFTKRKLVIISFIFIIMGLCVSVLFTIHHFQVNPKLMLVNWYTNIWNVLFSIGVAILLLIISDNTLIVKTHTVFAWLAKRSMAVFFCHSLILDQVVKYTLSVITHMLLWEILSIWLMTIVFSFIVVWIIGYIPVVGKILVKD